MCGSRTRLIAIAVAVTLAAACGAGGTSTTPAADGGGASGIGAPEKSSIRVVVQAKDSGSNGPFVVGTGKGFFEKQGLQVKVGFADDPRPALVSCSAQVGVLEVPYLAQAVDEGLDLVMFAGYRCVEPLYIAAQPGISSPRGLAGKDVFVGGLPGNPVVDFALNKMKEEGWDLSGVDANFVKITTEAPDDLFINNRLAATKFYREEWPALRKAGANVIVSELLFWPNEVLVAKRSFIQENPNTIRHFLLGMLHSTAWFKDLSHKQEFLEMARAQGYPTDLAAQDYQSGPYLFCKNLYLEPSSTNRQLETYGAPGNLKFDDFATTDHLLKAQQKLGLENRPPPPDERPSAKLPGQK